MCNNIFSRVRALDTLLGATTLVYKTPFFLVETLVIPSIQLVIMFHLATISNCNLQLIYLIIFWFPNLTLSLWFI
jgi:hypothetical protein